VKVLFEITKKEKQNNSSLFVEKIASQKLQIYLMKGHQSQGGVMSPLIIKPPKQYANGSYAEVWFNEGTMGPGTAPLCNNAL